MSQDLSVSSKLLSIWSPYILHLLVVQPLVLVLVIKSSKEPSIKAHLCKKPGIGVRVTKWINLPADSWLDAKGVSYPLVTNHHVLDHILVDWASLIMHRPAGIDNLKLPILDEFVNISPSLLTLLIPPHFEELHFNLRELSFWVILEGIHNGCDLNVDICQLDILASPFKILFECLEPSNIVVGMRHNMNSGRATTLIYLHIRTWVVLMELTLVYSDPCKTNTTK